MAELPDGKRDDRRVGLVEQLKAIPPDLAGKATAVIGAGLYGVLFLAYRAYYDRLEISPEDVGVTYSYVLVRSIGFILVTILIFSVILSFFYLASELFSSERPSRQDFLRMAGCGVLGAFAGYYFFVLFPFSTPIWAGIVVGVVLLGLAVVLPMMRPKGDDKNWRITVVLLTLVLSVLIPAIALVLQGVDRGNAARSAGTVSALSFLNIPLLDVTAPSARVYWTNTSTAAPAEFFGAGPPQGVVLGQTGTAVLVAINPANAPRIVRFNSSSVIISYLDTRGHA